MPRSAYILRLVYEFGSLFETQRLGFPLSILARIPHDIINTVLVIKVGNRQIQHVRGQNISQIMPSRHRLTVVRFALGVLQGACHFRVISLEQNAEKVPLYGPFSSNWSAS
jgi:hypothetical protein